LGAEGRPSHADASLEGIDRPEAPRAGAALPPRTPPLQTGEPHPRGASASFARLCRMGGGEALTRPRGRSSFVSLPGADGHLSRHAFAKRAFANGLLPLRSVGVAAVAYDDLSGFFERVEQELQPSLVSLLVD